MHKPRQHLSETPKKATSLEKFSLSQSKSTQKPRTTNPLHRWKQISLPKAHNPLSLTPLPPTTAPLHLHPHHHHPLHLHHPLIPSQIYPNQLHPLNQKQPYQFPSQKNHRLQTLQPPKPPPLLQVPRKKRQKEKRRRKSIILLDFGSA